MPLNEQKVGLHAKKGHYLCSQKSEKIKTSVDILTLMRKTHKMIEV